MEMMTIGAIALFFVALGLLHTVRIPLWEAPDEPLHLARARDMATGQSSMLSSQVRSIGVEYHPPLYYVLIAPAVAIGNRPLDQRVDSLLGIQRGVVLAARTARIASILFGTITVIAIYLLVRRLFSSHRFASAVAAFTSLTPAFVMTNSTVNDDVAATTFSSLTLLFACYLTLDRSRRYLWLVVLTLGLSAALLTKITTLFLVPVAALAIVRWLSQLPALHKVVTGSLALLIGIGGWTFLRSNDLGIGNRLDSILAGRSVYSLSSAWATLRSLTLGDLSALGDRLITTYWGIAGWQTFEPLPLVERWVVLLLVTLAAVGCVVFLFRRNGWRVMPAENRRTLVILGLGLSLVAVEMVLTDSAKSNLRDQGVAHARYILPAVGLVSTVLLGGIFSIVPSSRRGHVLVVLMISLATLYIQPTFSQPSAYSGPLASAAEEDSISSASRSYVLFENGISLNAHSDLPTDVEQGSYLDLSLYWGANADLRSDVKAFVHLVSADGRMIAQSDEVPTLHRFPPRVWRRGDSIRDNRRLNLPLSAAPGRYAVKIGMYAGKSSLIQVKQSNLDAERFEVAIGYVKLHPIPVDPSAISVPSHISFGDQLELVGYDLAVRRDISPFRIDATLFWRSQKLLTKDFSFSLQLIDDGGHLVKQVDQLAGGTYSSSMWGAGELVSDRVSLLLDNGEPARGSLGLAIYHLPDMSRLPYTHRDGSAGDGLLRIQEVGAAP